MGRRRFAGIGDNIHNRARFAFAHLRKERLHAVISAIEIGVHHLVVIAEREHFQGAVRHVRAGGIDERFHAAEFREHALAHLGYVFGLADIAGDDQRAGNLRGDGFERFAAAAEQGDAPTLFAESDGDGGAHATAGAGDDCGFFHRDAIRYWAG
nr:hypothetical protein [Chthoniobacter flavus]